MGYIFAIYSVAVIVISPMVGKLIANYGRRNLIILGILLMGISFICFGAASYIENTHLFIGISFVTRFLQGAASSLI